MKLDRKKNTKRNIIFGFVNKIVGLLFPFAIRTIIIKILCIDYLGLNSLFTSILNFLNIAELGFGTAMVYGMYKPIAEDNNEEINALLNLYKKIYRIVGSIVLFLGLIIMPFLPKLIKGTYPSDINLYVLYLIFLANSVLGYFCFAYKSSILTAYQRNDILSKISLLVNILLYTSQILLLLLFKNYYLYIITMPISTLINNIMIQITTKKLFPQHFCEGKISTEKSRELKKQIYALFLHRIGYAIQSSIDNICLSAFLGLTILGKYNNYFYIISGIESFITIYKQSLLAGIGNGLVIENKEDNKKHFYQLLCANAWIICWCTTCLMCLYQPFMKLWVGSENMLNICVVACLGILFYVNQIRSTVGLYKDALGMWYEDRLKPISISLVNLIGTIIFAYFQNLYGVILTTAFAYLVVGLPWETHVFFKSYMTEKPYKYYLKQLFYFAVSLIAVFLTYFVCLLVKADGVLKLIYNGLICLVLPNLIFIIFAFRLNEFDYIRQELKKMYKKIRHIGGKIIRKLPIVIENRTTYDINKSCKVYKKLKKRYGKFVNVNIKQENKTSNYIFTCWLQGEENAPELVKFCFESMRKAMPERELVIITSENLRNYVELPDFIMKKWENGKISNTHFSDILRTALLVKFGGLWLDSTVYCTGNIERYIDKHTNLFVYKNEHRGDLSCVLSSWLIYSKKNNPILVNTLNILYKYWKENNSLVDYFLFHKIFTFVSEKFPKEWNEIPFYSNIEPHILWFHYFYSDFDNERLNYLKKLSNFHKLSYKFNENDLKKNNFYSKMIKHGKGEE